jgi:hypothetical protein
MSSTFLRLLNDSNSAERSSAGPGLVRSDSDSVTFVVLDVSGSPISGSKRSQGRFNAKQPFSNAWPQKTKYWQQNAIATPKGALCK